MIFEHLRKQENPIVVIDTFFEVLTDKLPEQGYISISDPSIGYSLARVQPGGSEAMRLLLSFQGGYCEVIRKIAVGGGLKIIIRGEFLLITDYNDDTGEYSGVLHDFPRKKDNLLSKTDPDVQKNIADIVKNLSIKIENI